MVSRNLAQVTVSTPIVGSSCPAPSHLNRVHIPTLAILPTLFISLELTDLLKVSPEVLQLVDRETIEVLEYKIKLLPPC